MVNRICIRLLLALGLIALVAPVSQGQYGFTNVDAESITMMAGDLKLTSWVYYNGSDAPTGAYFANFPGTTTNSVTGTITLPRQLAAGTYRLFLEGIDYDQGKSATVAIGTNPAVQLPLNDRDVSMWWSEAAILTVTTPSNLLQITINRNTATNTPDQKYLFKGFYITSNPLEVVDKTGMAIKLVLPTVMDDSTPVKGNLIPDGGFESGVNGWGYNGSRSYPVSAARDTTVAYEGQSSIKIPIHHTANDYGDNMSINSRVYRLKPNKKYSVSAWVKTLPGQRVAILLGLQNTYVPGAGNPPQTQIAAFIYATEEWQRVTATGYALDYPSTDFYLTLFSNELNPTGYLWVDAVQLEEGDVTPYAPSSPISAAVAMAPAGNIFYSNEAIQATLSARNLTTTAANATFRYEVYDFMNRLVLNRTQALSIAGGASVQLPISLSTGKMGEFRVFYWIDGMANTEGEVVYSVVPKPPILGVDTASYLGIHPNYIDAQLAVLQRMGIKWARAMSPSGFFRWSVVEPVEGQIAWYDEQINKALQYGISTLGTIGTNNYWPAWADNGGLPDLDKWQKFVGDLALHYKTNVQYWEIWNEPGFTPDFYAKMLKRAVDAIEVNNPNAKIVGMGGQPRSAVLKVIEQLELQFPTWDWKTHIDVLSMHGYPDGEPPENFPDIIAKYNVAVWNTETGAWDRGSLFGVNSTFVTWGKNLWPYADGRQFYEGGIGTSESVVKNFLRTVASKLTGYYYYDSRSAASPMYLAGHPTITEWDGSVRAKGIAYAIAGSLVDKSVGMGNVAVDAQSVFLLFDKPGAPIAALYSADKRPRQVTLPLTSSQFQVLDMMGNVIGISGSIIPYGRLPVYVRGIGITTDVLKSALQTGAVVMRGDSQAPNVAILDWPRTALLAGNFRVRFVATDDTSYPNIGEVNQEASSAPNTPEPDALQYSYILTGGPTATWSPWSSKTYVDYTNIANGTYTFSVKAKDAVGNESVAVSRSVVVGSITPIPIPVPTLTSITPISSEVNNTLSVNVAGSNFISGGTSLSVSGTGVAVSNVAVVNPAQLTATFTIASGAPAGIRQATVTTVGGTSTGVSFTLTGPPPVTDTIPPVPGNFGSVASSVTANTLRISWVAGTDNVTPQGNLMYAVYLSRSPISSLAQAKSATKVMDYTANVTNFQVTGLSAGTFYYAAVIVRDAAGNETMYQVAKRKTANH